MDSSNNQDESESFISKIKNPGRLIVSNIKPKLHFSGKSAPEIFVGRIGYPYINSGILAPQENDNVSNFATAEEWSKNNFSVANVLRLRSQLIYGRSKTNIKIPDRIKEVSQELALSHAPVSTEIFLKKIPTTQVSSDSIFRPMTNPAPIAKAILEENPKVSKKVDYITSDYDVKAVDAVNELYKSRTKVDQLQKLLSIGLLGKKIRRRMVPTRWSITATDDIISKEMLEKIRYYPEINEAYILSANFVGNYIEALFLPGKFAFEIIEFWISENGKIELAQDYESFSGRKKYASSVTGGYYATRIAITEYLEKIKRQGAVLVFRKITPEYYAPLGVGIVREAVRRATQNSPQYFDSKELAINSIETSLELGPSFLSKNSKLLSVYGKQKTLKEFF